MNDYISEALHLSVGLVGLWLVTFWLFHDYRIDALRQRLFDLRAELFDYAASGAVPFDHPAYGLLRRRMNLMIRFAHRFTLIQLVLVLIFEQDNPPAPEPYAEWRSALATIESVEVRHKLHDFNYRMFMVLIFHLVTGSVVLAAGLKACFAAMEIKGTADRFAGWCTSARGLRKLEMQAAELEGANVSMAT